MLFPSGRLRRGCLGSVCCAIPQVVTSAFGVKHTPKGVLCIANDFLFSCNLHRNVLPDGHLERRGVACRVWARCAVSYCGTMGLRFSRFVTSELTGGRRRQGALPGRKTSARRYLLYTLVLLMPLAISAVNGYCITGMCGFTTNR